MGGLSVADAAAAVAEAIGSAALHHRGGATWCEATVTAPARPLAHRTGDPTFYQGTAGLAWALTAVGGATDDSALVELAAAAARDALSRVDGLAAPGLYDGRAGVGLAAGAVGARTGDAGLRDAGLAVLVEAGTGDDEGDDLISGAAGVILALLAAAADSPSRADQLVELAGARATGVLRRARTSGWGCGWAQPGTDWLPLCGLAHGSSGIALALGELQAAGAAPPWVDGLVDAALDHERTWFDLDHHSWPDLRVGRPGATSNHDGAGPGPALWCHGAAGIGVARLHLARLGGPASRPGLVAESAAALQATCVAAVRGLSHGDVGAGLTLCHGYGGAAELFLTAHEVLGEGEHLATARWIVDHTLALVGDDVTRWPIGLPGAGSSFGLMTGLAGTLVTLTRLGGADGLPDAGLPIRRRPAA